MAHAVTGTSTGTSSTGTTGTSSTGTTAGTGTTGTSTGTTGAPAGTSSGVSPASLGVAVFDIDGVLADVRHRLHHVARRPKDWDGFFGAAPLDPPLAEGLAAVRTAAAAGHTVVYLTGRPERCRAETLTWLAEQGLPIGELFMRPVGDRRPARFTKVATLRRLAKRHDVVVFVDDDAAVVTTVRAAGFPVLHASWMGTETEGADGAPERSAAAVLFEIQESDPHT